MSKLLFHIIFLPIVILIANSSLVYSADSCIDCHGNTVKMKDSGYPHFFVSLAEIQAQTKMPALCIHCHEGNNQALDKDEAHKGLLTLRAVGRDWDVLRRTEMNTKDLKDWQNLETRGKDRATQLSPKIMLSGDLKDNSAYKTFILHDKNSETLAFNPDIAMRTCGQCHEDAVKSFLKSSMGGGKGVHAHSQYITWTGRTGPQSCGLWVGALSKPNQDKFTPENVKYFNQFIMLYSD